MLNIQTFFFKNIFHVRYQFLMFFTVIGVSVGGYLDLSNDFLYRTEMIVMPKYNTAIQLVSNIEYYDEQIVNRDSIILAEELKMEKNEAAGITSIKIERNEDLELQKRQFSKFVNELHPLAKKELTYEKFVKNRGVINDSLSSYVVRIEALSPEIAEKCKIGIVHSFYEIGMVKNKTKRFRKELKNKILYEDKFIKELDCLDLFYKNVKVIEFHDLNHINNELPLIGLFSLKQKELRPLLKENNFKALNVISSTNPKKVNSSFFIKKIILIPFLFIIFWFLLIFFVKIRH